MPETFTGPVWVNDQAPALNATNLNGVMVGIETIDDRVHSLELGVIAPIVVPYATSVTLNATQGSLFRCVASGDLTMDAIVGGADGQTIVFEVQASGAPRTLSFTGSTDTISITVGQWWVGVFRFVSSSGAWLRDDGSGGGSGGSGNELNILAPQDLPYAATITPNAATGALFRITAPGNFTLADPINGTDGQAVVVEVFASGGARTVTLAGGQASPVVVPTDTRWIATLRYDAGVALWMLAQRSDVGVAEPTVLRNTQAGTTYTLVATDAGKVVEMNNAAANVLTIPASTTVPFPLGTYLSVCQYGAGQTTIAEAVGVTIRSLGNAKKLTGQYAEATLRQRTLDVWVMSGELTT